MTEQEIERLEHDLQQLGRAIVYPPTPGIASAVRQRIDEGSAPQRASAWALAAVAAASAAIFLIAVIGSVGPARDAVADFFDRINIFETSSVPPGTPTGIEGVPVTLGEAEQALGFEIVLPNPDTATVTRVLLQDFGNVRAAAIFIEGREMGEFVLFETDAGAGKGLAPGASAEPVEGLAEEAYWLEGLRIVQYEDDGNAVEESVRVTEANTLLWVQDGYVFRLEGNLSQDEAVLIARSLR